MASPLLFPLSFLERNEKDHKSFQKKNKDKDLPIGESCLQSSTTRKSTHLGAWKERESQGIELLFSDKEKAEYGHSIGSLGFAFKTPA